MIIIINNIIQQSIECTSPFANNNKNPSHSLSFIKDFGIQFHLQVRIHQLKTIANEINMYLFFPAIFLKEIFI